jgi:hypothetical protein
VASVFSAREPWFPLPNRLITDGAAFQLASEEKLMKSPKGGLFQTLSQNEWRVLTVIAARCGNKETGHSKYISNEFIRHFTKLRQDQFDIIRASLESDDCKLFRSERSENGRGRTYWMLDEDGQPYDGATVWDEHRRASQVTSSREAGQRRKAKPSDAEEDIPKGKWKVNSIRPA